MFVSYKVTVVVGLVTTWRGVGDEIVWLPHASYTLFFTVIPHAIQILSPKLTNQLPSQHALRPKELDSNREQFLAVAAWMTDEPTRCLIRFTLVGRSGWVEQSDWLSSLCPLFQDSQKWSEPFRLSLLGAMPAPSTKNIFKGASIFLIQMLVMYSMTLAGQSWELGCWRSGKVWHTIPPAK